MEYYIFINVQLLKETTSFDKEILARNNPLSLLISNYFLQFLQLIFALLKSKL